MPLQPEIRRIPYDHLDATLLREAQQQEISPLRPIGPGVPASAANVPIFLIAYNSSGEPIGCGGLRPLADQGLPGQAEVKRMYVVPAHQGRDAGTPSLALLMLQALEREAMAHEWQLLKVETSKAMAQAMRFYEKCGYMSCEVFGAYRGSEHAVCYEKHLAESGLG